MGSSIKSDVKKLKKLKKILVSVEQEKREVHKTLESILENTLDFMNKEDAKAFLLRKIRELNIDQYEAVQAPVNQEAYYNYS